LHDEFLVVKEVILLVKIVQFLHANAKVCDGGLLEVFWLVNDFRDHDPTTEEFKVLPTLKAISKYSFGIK
jgi:hypothetical protein